MRKNNWIFFIVAAIVSVFLVLLWYYLGFNKVDAPLDMVLSIVWIAFMLVVAVVLNRMEEKRRRLLRALYVAAPPVCFNTSVGLINYADQNEFISKAENVLANIDYDETPEKATSSFQPIFEVQTVKFDADNNVWKGKVVDGKSGKGTSFDSVTDLERAISGYFQTFQGGVGA